MSAPRLWILLELEASPRLIWDTLSESEHDRLGDWLLANEDLAYLLGLAYTLVKEARADA
jgi:hypothetical protein